MKIRKATLKYLKELYAKKSADALLNSATKLQVECPNSIIARVYVSRGLALGKRFAEAADILESVVLPFPKLKRVYLEYIRYLKAAGREAQWEIQSFRFLEYHSSSKLCYELGGYFFRKREWRRALSCYQRLREAMGRGGEQGSLTVLDGIIGMVYFHLEDFNSAIEYLSDSSLDSTCYYRARIYRDRGALGKAMTELRQMKGLSGDLRALNLGWELCRDLRDSEGEIEFLETLYPKVSKVSDKIKALQRMDWAAGKLGDSSYRVRVINTLRALGPDTLDLKKKAASLYWGLNRRRKASLLYCDILKDSSFDQESLDYLSRYYREQGDAQKAYNYLKAGFIGGANSFSMDMEFAELSLELGKFTEARDVLLELLKQGNSLARLYFLLSRVYEFQGQKRVSKYYRGLHEQSLQAQAA
jgi:hypothetical protein